MAIIKCKMCGGDLNLTEGQSVMECEYCGTQQTVPNLDSEKKEALFERAHRLRAACEFDKAAGVYESIVAEFRNEAEAYWGLVLCKYGIEYVDDPATGKKVPTCHRSSFDSVMDDPDLEQALENADAVARKVYRDEAKDMEELRRGIIEVSGKEEPYDIFICYKETDEKGERTIDSVIAQDVYDALTDKGYRVFFSRITLEDKLGQEYEPYIFAALNSAKIMLAFGTDYEYYNAVWVKNEWSRFLKLMAQDKEKHLIPCCKGIDAYDMPKEFAKLQAQDMGKVGAIQDLVRGIEKLLPKQATHSEMVVQQAAAPTGEAMVKRGMLALEEHEWEKATEFFEQALNQNPESGDAYLGKVLAELELVDLRALKRTAVILKGNHNFELALRFASPEQRGQLEQVQEECRQKEERKRAEQERKRVEQENKRAEQERKQAEKARTQVPVVRQRIALVQGLVGAELHTVAVKADGTVTAVGCNNCRQCEVSFWWDIVMVSAGDKHTVGLKSDGTVVAVGDNEYGQCNVSSWRNIVAVSAGASRRTLGLRSDGTVVAIGANAHGECNVSDWRDIIAISAGYGHSVGLKSDGTVVAVGLNRSGQCDVSAWKDVVAIAAGGTHTVGLKADGTVVAVGAKEYGKCKVSDWENIVAVSASHMHTVGLKSDGTVEATGNKESGQCDVYAWENIVAVFAGTAHTVGLKANGTLVVVGSDNHGQCKIPKQKLFKGVETFEKERKEHKEKLNATRKANLEAQQTALQQELANLKGLFSGFRRREIETRLTQIESELNKLK